MQIIHKRFDQLTPEELYAILALRSQVFVVEQNCVYQDLDGRDQSAFHMWLEDEDGIEAYLRILDSGVVHEDCAIGRVLCLKRRKGYASKLLSAALDLIAEEKLSDQVYLEAQEYAKSLYGNLGFKQISEPFLEDGIPHVAMELTLSERVKTEDIL